MKRPTIAECEQCHAQDEARVGRLSKRVDRLTDRLEGASNQLAEERRARQRAEDEIAARRKAAQQLEIDACNAKGEVEEIRARLRQAERTIDRAIIQIEAALNVEYRTPSSTGGKQTPLHEQTREERFLRYLRACLRPSEAGRFSMITHDRVGIGPEEIRFT